ncbi:MAG: hypothetical protein AB1502_09220 [Thermodesulfobacteriota bacterium]
MLTYPTKILEDLNVDVLKALARKINLPKSLTRKGDLIEAMARKVEKDLQGVLNYMSNIELLLLAEAAFHNGRINPSVFSSKYGISAPLPNPWMRPDQAVLTALMFQRNTLNIYEVPKELIKPLQDFLPQPAQAKVKTVDSLPASHLPPKRYSHSPDQPPRLLHIHEGEKAVFTELRRVLRLVQAGKIKVTDKGRRPTDSAVRLLLTALDSSDFDLKSPFEETNKYEEKAGAVRAHAWGVLIQQCKWAKPKASTLGLTEAGKEMLNGPDVSRYKDSVEAFLKNDDFDELNRIEHIQGQSGRAKRYMTSPSERKIPIVDSISLWPVNRWLSVEEAYRFAFASGNDFRVTDEPYNLYFSEHQYGHFGDIKGELERQYLRALLMESLTTLGLVDIAYVFPHHLWPELGDRWGKDEMSFCSRYDGLLYVRLNELGAFVFNLSDTWTPPVTAEGARNLFAILPNHEIAVTQSKKLSPDEIAGLEMCAILKSDYIWELNTHQMLTYFESGGSMEEITTFLRSNSSTGIPEGVDIFLREVAEKVSAVKEGEEALLFTIKDEATAALIASDSDARKYCFLAGTDRLAVPKKNQRAFRSALKKLGYVIPS